MKTFIRRTVLFLLPVLLLIAVAGFTRKQLTEKDMMVEYKNEVITNGWVSTVQDVKGFIIGSSSLKYGLSAVQLSAPGASWLNLSIDGGDPVLMYLTLKHYCKIINPECVLVSLDPWIYAKKYYAKGKPIMYLDLTPSETFNYFHNDKQVLLKKTQVLVLSSLGLPSCIYKKPDVLHAVPKDMGSVKLNRAAVNFSNISNDWFEIDKTGWSDLEFSYIARIYEYCSANHIELIFLVPPKRADYIQWAGRRFNAEHRQWWQKINSIIPNAKIIGSYDMLKDYDQDSIFAEAYHLNAAGQEIYTRKVKELLPYAKHISVDHNFISPVAVH